jgi:hypothetical protein
MYLCTIGMDVSFSGILTYVEKEAKTRMIKGIYLSIYLSILRDAIFSVIMYLSIYFIISLFNFLFHYVSISLYTYR